LFKTERYRQEFYDLLKICQDRNIAVQTIKSITKGPWADKTRNRNTWYEPLEDQEDINKAVSWILGQEDIFLNTCSDSHLLSKVLEAARSFEKKPSAEDMETLVKENKMSRLFVS
jgi:hypothetical protein